MRWEISIEGSDEITRGQRCEFEIEKNFGDLTDGSVGLSIEDGKTILASLQRFPELCPKVGDGVIRISGEKRAQLGFDRLRDQLPRALAQQIRQRVGRKSFWRAKRDNRILRHVAYPFLCENCGASTTP